MSVPIPGVGPLIDTHAHLDDPRLFHDLDGIIDRALSVGLINIVSIGTTVEDSIKACEVAGRYPGIYAAVGVQPNHVAEAREGDWGRITELAIRPRVVALGETGLDRYWDRAPFDLQQVWFARHLGLASELDLPVVIHCRDCESDIIAQLEALDRPVQGVLHSFTGTTEHARAFVRIGLHISFAGMLTFTNKKLDPLRDAAAVVPKERLLVETDSPYLSPHPVRGRTNEPAHVAWTARKLAEVIGIPPEELAAITTQNARRLFGITVTDVL